MVSRLRTGDPTQVGRYQVRGRIGGGGMGMVYLADGPRGTVALKLVRPELGDDPHFRARFRREVQSSFRVSGVCTVRLLDFDTEADQPWMATEYVDGPSLTELIEAGGPLSQEKQLALAVGLAEALQSIHDEDVVHRDLKPSNVLCAPTGPKVIDFGIAAAADAAPITRSGLMVGSPGWLSPEQITTGRATAASDIFALGCILAYAAGGEQPFGTGTAEALFYRVLNQGPTVDWERLASPLHDLVRTATAHDPTQRPTARAMLEALLDAGAVSGDVRGDTGTSVTSVLQRNWSLPTGLRYGSDDVVPSGERSHPSRPGTEISAGAPSLSRTGALAGPAPTAGPPASVAPPGPWTPHPSTPHPTQVPTPPPFPASFPQRAGPSTPPPGPGWAHTPGPYPSGPAYSPAPPTTPRQGSGGFGPPTSAGTHGGGPRRKQWLVPAAVGGGVLAAVVVLAVVLVAGGKPGPTPAPTDTATVAAKDPNRTRTPAEIDELVRAAALSAADVPGATLDDRSEPPGFLMPCGFEIQDFPAGGRADGLDFKDADSNYTDERIWVGPDQARAATYLTKLKNLLASCAGYTDSSGDKATISANDRAWAIGDGAIYVDETKNGIHLSWGYMRQGTAIVLISTIADTDQKSTIGQQLTRVSDRLTAADAS